MYNNYYVEGASNIITCSSCMLYPNTNYFYKIYQQIKLDRLNIIISEIKIDFGVAI